MVKFNDKNKKEICSTLFYKQNNVGFTLLEVIVALFIINTSLAGSFGFITFFISAKEIANNRLVAVNLAQEGMEISRNLRDISSSWTDWHANIVNGDYLVQYDSSDFLAYQNKPLNIDVNGMYSYSPGSSTFFYRTISLDKISDDETKIISTVKWFQRGNDHQVQVEGRLFNWK